MTIVIKKINKFKKTLENPNKRTQLKRPAGGKISS
jgi:hypothetical protein